MAIVRFDPMRNLMRWPDVWEDFDRLADSALAVDVYETDNDVVVKMPMPGVKPEDIDVQVTGDTVTVRGQVKEEEEDTKRNYYYKEVRRGSYARSVTLPAPVQSDKADAATKDGILTLTLPKAEEAKPKAITVKAQDGK